MGDVTSTTAVHTVLGDTRSDKLGFTLPHEHLFNNIVTVDFKPNPKFPDLFHTMVSPEIAWKLNDMPLSCLDNCSLDNVDDALDELEAYYSTGASTLIELSIEGMGQNFANLQDVSRRSGVNIIAGGGFYLDRYHPKWVQSASVDEITKYFLETTFGGGYKGEASRPGVIGEIGVSPNFSSQELKVLRAACHAQRELRLPLFIHLPGFLRYANKVLDIVLTEQGVPPEAVVLCHMDPSGSDPCYQLRVAERGVWVEFDMIGMPYRFSLPGEGRAPSVGDTIAAVTRLVDAGFSKSLLFSHDMFLKGMLRRNGGNGLLYVPQIFCSLLEQQNIENFDPYSVNTENVRRLFELSAS